MKKDENIGDKIYSKHVLKDGGKLAIGSNHMYYKEPKGSEFTKYKYKGLKLEWCYYREGELTNVKTSENYVNVWLKEAINILLYSKALERRTVDSIKLRVYNKKQCVHYSDFIEFKREEDNKVRVINLTNGESWVIQSECIDGDLTVDTKGCTESFTKDFEDLYKVKNEEVGNDISILYQGKLRGFLGNDVTKRVIESTYRKDKSILGDLLIIEDKLTTTIEIVGTLKIGEIIGLVKDLRDYAEKVTTILDVSSYKKLRKLEIKKGSTKLLTDGEYIRTYDTIMVRYSTRYELFSVLSHEMGHKLSMEKAGGLLVNLLHENRELEKDINNLGTIQSLKENMQKYKNEWGLSHYIYILNLDEKVARIFECYLTELTYGKYENTEPKHYKYTESCEIMKKYYSNYLTVKGIGATGAVKNGDGYMYQNRSKIRIFGFNSHAISQ